MFIRVISVYVESKRRLELRARLASEAINNAIGELVIDLSMDLLQVTLHLLDLGDGPANRRDET